MSSMNARVSCFILCLIAAVLFQLTRTSVGMAFLGDVFAFALLGTFVAELIRLIARVFSPVVLLKAWISLIIGFGTATFIVLCSQTLFGQQAFPQTFDPFLRFLLPLSLTVVAFCGLQSLLFHRRISAHVGEDLIQRGEDEERLRTYIPDVSALEDGRVVDLARIGIFDNQIIIPTFLAIDLKFLSETGDEISRIRAKKAFDALRRLETLPKINIQTRDFHVAEELDLNEKILRSAKMAQSLVLTNEVTPLRPDAECFFAIDAIANALRPPIPKGEMLSIKIQRLGKEPKQGIGYLDDGTMVVVNGGGDFLRRTVRTQVLSQKYSSSGKIVFCNVCEDGYDERLDAYVVPYIQAENPVIGQYTP